MISSELEEIVEGADRVFVLRDGRTVAELAGGQLDEDACCMPWRTAPPRSEPRPSR